LRNGEPCSSPGQCLSIYWADGVCCQSACTGTCYACNLAGGRGSCSPIPRGSPDPSASTTCTGIQTCDGYGSCKKTDGQACASAIECGSGFCADGRCCESACDQPCYACNLGTTLGRCVPQVAGSHDDGACGAGTSVCGQACDGLGTCAFAVTTVSCGTTASCSAGVKKVADHCDGAGACADAGTRLCGGYQCRDAVECGTSCADDAGCTPDYFCSGGACLVDKTVAGSCDRDGQCQSGHCVDGVCCESACSATCYSCALPGKEGTCSAAPEGADPRKQCIGTGGCGGTCNGAGRCGFPTKGTSCGTCKACDGAGRCELPPEDDEACGIVDCDGLDSACRDYRDLRAKRCSGFGVCKAPNDLGTCTDYDVLPCPDGGNAHDAASTDAANTGDTSAGPSQPPKSTGCGSCALAPSHGRGGLAVSVLLVCLGLRRHRPRTRRARS
jgi:hypothetical protein